MSIEALKAERERVEAELTRIKLELAEAMKAAHPIQPGAIMQHRWDSKRGQVAELRVAYDKVCAHGFLFLKDGSLGKRDVYFYSSSWKPE